MRFTRSVLFCLVAATISCGGAPKTAPEPSAHALSGLAAQHIAVLPTYTVRVMPGLSWASSVGSTSELRKTLDADIASAFDERGLRKAWLFPEELERSYKRNTTYAADPYSLAEEPLRAPALMVDARLPEPFASQIRTLVALHDDTRLVLAPVELRLEPTGAGRGRGVLRLVLVDARTSNVRWIGEIPSDTVSTFGPVITADIAAKLANVVAIP
jgi:hypothetical protein